MSVEFWVRLWRGRAASLLRYEGEMVIVSVAGEELSLPKETWMSLPPYVISSAVAV
jgi:hypothetical protein